MITEVVTERAAGPGAADVDVPAPTGRRRLASVGWWLLPFVVVNGGYALIAIGNPGFFLVDDTETAILPMFSHLGHELRNGIWPGVTERNWTVGLVAADPQYALFNPVSLFSYWLVEPIGSLHWRLLLIVLLWVNLLVVGVVWAARSIGSSPPFAALAGAIVGLNVFVLYWYAAGWTTLLPGVAWFALAVAAVLAAVERPDRPWRAVVAGIMAALLVSSGNPFAVVAVVATLAILAVWTLIARDLHRVRQHGLTIAATVSGGVLGAAPWLVAMAYIPSTRRETGIFNNGFLTLHLESLLLSFSPSIRPFTGSFNGWGPLDQPVTYGSWLFAGAAAMFVVRRGRMTRSQWAVLVAGAVLFVATLGPERFGPLRWPFRFVPFAIVLLAVAAVVVVERSFGWTERADRRHRLVLVVVAAVAAVASFQLQASVLASVVTALALGLGVPFVVWCVRRQRRVVLALGGTVVTALVWAAIVAGNTATSDLVDLGGPGDIRTAQEDLEPLTGQRTLQLVGPMPEGLPSVLSHLYSLYGTERAEVINGYTSLVPEGLASLLCLEDSGYTCPAAATKIFEREPDTGLRYIDLLGVTQVLVQRGPLLDAFEAARTPEWRAADESEWWVTYRNGTELGADPVVWTTDGGARDPGSRPSPVSVPAGGRIVLSRPPWPGTTVSIGGIEGRVESVGGTFLAAAFDEAAEGEVAVGHQIPGGGSWRISALVGLAGLLGCCVVAARRTWRHRRR